MNDGLLLIVLPKKAEFAFDCIWGSSDMRFMASLGVCLDVFEFPKNSPKFVVAESVPLKAIPPNVAIEFPELAFISAASVAFVSLSNPPKTVKAPSLRSRCG
jgi:hypothetical protein